MTDAELARLRAAGPEQWAVYADERMAQGDPRGELIRAQLGIESAFEEVAPLRQLERELFTRHQEALLGPRGILGTITATWRCGFIHSAWSPPMKALRVLLTHPSGQLLQELELANPNLPMDDQLDVVGHSKHPSLRRVKVNATASAVRFIGTVGLDAVLAGLPLLEVLFVAVDEVTFGRGGTSPVIELSLMARANVSSLADWTFPRLRSLELSGSIPLPVLVLPPRLADGLCCPSLTSLVLRDFQLEAEFCDGLARLLRNHEIDRLDLSNCRASSLRLIENALGASMFEELKLPVGAE